MIILFTRMLMRHLHDGQVVGALAGSGEERCVQPLGDPQAPPSAHELDMALLKLLLFVGMRRSRQGAAIAPAYMHLEQLASLDWVGPALMPHRSLPAILRSLWLCQPVE